MRFVIAIFVQLGLWFLFASAFNPEFMSGRYLMALIGCLLLGVTAGLLYGAWEEARKEDRNADAKEDANESASGSRGTNS